jgi:MerR family transcriptional regulator/heat shock protein HspR
VVGAVTWPDPNRALFAISVAAELTGLHPQTLRIYEREGLLEPARSPGGTRRYSSDEIDRLREIAALTAAGLNIAGVRRVLDLERQMRRLEADVSVLRELQQEVRRLKAELASAKLTSGRATDSRAKRTTDRPQERRSRD